MNIIEFFAKWCKPCISLSEALKEANIEYKAVDVDTEENLTEELEILSVPTVVVLSSTGEELGRFIGSKSKDEILKELDKYRQKELDTINKEKQV